ncbi:hypothetical protein WA026_017313 [Henosepilachna vigintioctopunctata]|uniref:Pre-rRNA-processing protein TSR1 homolog n=1 Tax=Henosepilachna vigintioctopunctata TaxID=420089 RepID=A0AAW1UGG4_9CUCU
MKMGTDKQQETHRPGACKQINKLHKEGRHRSQRTLHKLSKGKESVKKISKKVKKELGREERRNQALQIRKNKREELLNKKRQIGSLDLAPFLVCIVPLNKNHDPNTVLNLLMQCDSEATVKNSPQGITHISVPRFKQRFAFISPPLDNEFAILDSLKVCDRVVFLLSAALEDAIDTFGENILSAALGQGLPSAILALTDLESVPPKRKQTCKQNLQKSISNWFPGESLVTLDKDADGVNLLRKIGNQKIKPVHYRDNRPHLVAEDVQFVPDVAGALGTLKVTGFLRGCPLSVNSLVHLPGLGDFQMTQIDVSLDPYQIYKNKNRSHDEMTMKVLEKSDPNKQESLVAENIIDCMEAEEAFPSAEEIKMAEEEQKNKNIAWPTESDTDCSSESGEQSEDENEIEAMSEEESEDEVEQFEIMTQSEVPVNDDKYDKEMDLEAEKNSLELLKTARTDQIFPDEIDTPKDEPARVKFQKYVGLESFRTSPWNPKENVPSDYSRIFQFENFVGLRKSILKKSKDVQGAMPGGYYTIHIKDVSELAWTSFKEAGCPLILIGMFQHEHKMSLANVVLQRTKNYSLPIKAKSRLIFQCGYRRFIVCPIFSDHTYGDKHKAQRFFQPDSNTVATFYAPIQFPPSPVLCYKEVNNNLILIAKGNLMSCNPDRIILKRIVLSGFPFKIHKRSAVIRFMFFNREDILYYKACKLRTKMGRVGHIKEPLGTHGHMKCIFDGPLKSEDTVLLNLYKRVFPKWTYEPLLINYHDEMEI